MNNEQVKTLATNLRVLSAAGVESANSGHPGMPMGTADIAAVMWSEFLKFNPEDPEWLGRDRFVLSAGHGSMLLYSLLHAFNFGLTEQDLRDFRQMGSLTPGHPEYGITKGVETTTGPLGQGFANGVGMALSAKMMASRYQTDLLGYNVFGIVSDGDLMEGVAAEAASLAAHWKLDNLIYVYDDNDISIGGHTDICFTENVPDRFKSYGWNVLEVDGHDHEELRKALADSIKHEGTPTLIVAHTKIGFGSPNKVNTSGVHGSPLGESEFDLFKKEVNWELGDFELATDVKDLRDQVLAANQEDYGRWQEEFKSWKEANSELSEAFSRQIAKEIPEELETELFSELGKIEKEATRGISGKAIQIIAKYLAGFCGGSADLEPSTKTLINDSGDVTAADYNQKNLRYGVREHAMGAIANGFAYCSGWFPYTATFLVFSDYMRPTVRLAALSHLQTLFIFTHDSFYVGEDGPTHQPIEHLTALRCIPNVDVYRPADGIETAASYVLALRRQKQPAAMLFTRQGLPKLKRSENFDNQAIYKGAYVLRGEDQTDCCLIASGSEVSLAEELAESLGKEGKSVRVVSVPCLEIFMEQTPEERSNIIPDSAKKVVVEAGSSWGWGNVVGNNVLYITKDSYGASAPAGDLAKEFGFTVETALPKVKAYFA